MDMTTNSGNKKSGRSGRAMTTVIVGCVTLILGLVIGAAAEESGARFLSGKAPAAATTNEILAASAVSPPAGGSPAWDPFQEVRRMQEQMDESFDRMFDQIRTDPQFDMFRENPGYSLSLDVRDLSDHYEIRAYLPDAKASDVHVNLANGRTLTVQVNHQQTQTTGKENLAASTAEWGQYQQEVQLPGPVKGDQMKVKREGHELVITLPKGG